MPSLCRQDRNLKQYIIHEKGRKFAPPTNTILNSTSVSSSSELRERIENQHSQNSRNLKIH